MRQLLIHPLRISGRPRKERLSTMVRPHTTVKQYTPLTIAAGTYSECTTRRPHAHIDIIAGESEGQSGCAAYVKRSHRTSVNGAPTYMHTTYVQSSLRTTAPCSRPRYAHRQFQGQDWGTYIRTYSRLPRARGDCDQEALGAEWGGLLLSWTRPLLPHRSLSAHGKGLVRGTCSAQLSASMSWRPLTVADPPHALRVGE